MTRLVLVRHGPTHAREMIGWTDRPADLSDQARLNRIRADLPDLPVVSSDLSRAIATADALAEGRRRLPHEPGLRELHFGDWEGAAFAEIEAQAPDHLRAFYETPGDIAPPGGESWNRLRKRVDAVIDSLLDANPRGVIAVAHFGPILTQVQRATGTSAYEVFAQKIDPLSVTRLTVETCWQLDDVNHHP